MHFVVDIVKSACYISLHQDDEGVKFTESFVWV